MKRNSLFKIKNNNKKLKLNSRKLKNRIILHNKNNN